MSRLISKILSVLTPRPIIWIFITGRRHSLRKYDVSEHFKERKPPYVQKFIHEMMWGKTLRNLVKRGVQIAEEALSRFPDALGLQSDGLTTAPLAADYGIQPIFDEFFQHVEPIWYELTSRSRERADSDFPWVV